MAFRGVMALYPGEETPMKKTPTHRRVYSNADFINSVVLGVFVAIGLIALGALVALVVYFLDGRQIFEVVRFLLFVVASCALIRRLGPFEIRW